MKKPPRILSIAGSDSSGGAGIQADIKTVTMLGGYAMTAITAVTAQNSVGVQAIVPISADVVTQQIISCVSDIGVDAIKIGMVHDPDIIAAVAAGLAEVDPKIPLVLDPVMIATSGAALIGPDAIAAMRETLFPRAGLLTPNLPELEHLSGGEALEDTAKMEAAAQAIASQYNTNVLAKGGHTDDVRIIDLLTRANGAAERFEHARIDTQHTHGTGCTLSSAIATFLGHGVPLTHAVKLGRQFVLQAIKAAPEFGAGSGPLGHHAVRGLD